MSFRPRRYFSRLVWRTELPLWTERCERKSDGASHSVTNVAKVGGDSFRKYWASRCRRKSSLSPTWPVLSHPICFVRSKSLRCRVRHTEGWVPTSSQGRSDF